MDGDMNDIFQKLNTILENKDMSDNIKNIIENFSSSQENNSDQESNNQTSESQNNASNTEKNSTTTSIPDFDINTILKIKKIMDSLNNQKKDDPRSNLLLSLKPYLSDSKKEKIDNYIKFLQIANVIETIGPQNIIGGDNKKNE